MASASSYGTIKCINCKESKHIPLHYILRTSASKFNCSYNFNVTVLYACTWIALATLNDESNFHSY